MKELVIISGKGGTGKTSIAASFAALSPDSVLADCDVDAADLHLILSPVVRQREDFSGGREAKINPALCNNCRKCAELCRFDAVKTSQQGNGDREAQFRIDPILCEGCGVCVWFCPCGAIDFAPAVNGEWYISDTRHGPMVHARLGIAQENSGKLVSTVRRAAREIAQEQARDLVLIDGSPGIGCPVIASLTGADLALIVTEPTVSGLHDLARVAELARHFDIPALVCINKWDLNTQMADRIEAQAREHGICVAGRVRYDRAITEAQIHRWSVVEYQSDGPAADIRAVWEAVRGLLCHDAAESAGTGQNDQQTRKDA